MNTQINSNLRPGQAYQVDHKGWAVLRSTNSGQAEVVFPQCPLDRKGRDVFVPEGTWLPADSLAPPKKLQPGPLDLEAKPEVRQDFQAFLDQGAGLDQLTDEPQRWEAVAPANDAYNCVARTLGILNEPVWPSFAVGSYDRLYAEQGYVAVEGGDPSFEVGTQKAILFAYQSQGGVADPGSWRAIAQNGGYDGVQPSCLPSHAVLQREDGNYLSKCGVFQEVAVTDPHDLEGPGYGQILKVYQRPCSDSSASGQ